MRVPRAWVIMPKYELALGAANKAGCTSLKQLALEMVGFKRIEDLSMVPRGYRKVGIIRHPVARFYSLFENIRSRKRNDSNFYAQFEGQSPEEVIKVLAAVIISGEQCDYHFQPQYMIGLERDDVELVRLDGLTAWWECNKPEGAPRMPQANRGSDSVAKMYADEAAQRVLHAYAKDMALWEKAACQGQ